MLKSGQLYFAAHGTEVWRCEVWRYEVWRYEVWRYEVWRYIEQGEMTFYNADGELETSLLVPELLQRIKR